MSDSLAANRPTASFHISSVGYPSDHFVIGARYDLIVKPLRPVSRPTFKPVGWAPGDFQGSNSNMAAHFMHIGPRSILNIIAVVKTIATTWTGPGAPSSLRGGRPTEECTRLTLSDPSLSPEQRRDLVDALWHALSRRNSFRRVHPSYSVCWQAGEALRICRRHSSLCRI